MTRSIAPLVVASLAVMGSPGPATISLTAAVSAYGVRRSLSYFAGLVAGTALVLVAVATGVTATLLAVPALHAVLIAVSAAYILWLAFQVATAPPLGAPASAVRSPSLAGGLLLGAANPKAWLAIGAVFATASAGALAKVGVLSLMIVLIMTAWLIVGASLAPLLRDARRARAVNVALAAALVGAAALAVMR